MFVFAEKLVTVGPAERCGGVFLGCGDDGPERDLRGFTVDACAPAVEPSDGFVAPEGLFCDRRRRVDILEEVVDAECGPNAAVGDAGSIVNEGSFLSAATRGARWDPSLDSELSAPSSGWEGDDNDDFLLAFEVCDGADEGADLGFGFAVGVFMLFSVVGEEP
jgi:hypothetical protein